MHNNIISSSGNFNCGALYGKADLGTIMDKGGAMERLEKIDSFYIGNPNKLDSVVNNVKDSSKEIIL